MAGLFMFLAFPLGLLGLLGFDLGVPTRRQRQEPALLRVLRNSPQAMPLLGLPAPQHGHSKHNL